ncbi:MAG TPA: pYEATS domain-containing protein [Thermoanaerobaculia bacterium]|jgi:MinD-like ATPase involved in chromosome partitioning or flagellar assembly
MSEQKAPARGRIITFYSYKGGTGRSMALANVGWILASAGRRVLLIDWDLEAPGLHRYFHPFLTDKELSSTPGLIDFFIDFTTTSRVVTTTPQPPEEAPWYEVNASLLRYACPIEWEFPSGGALELVPAGRQDAAYSMCVTSFDWQEFYERLGGGVFLEAVKRQLREQYDYILIDSRTGISDTSGICTVQMPDDLIVCFTFNEQSLKGAAAVADSADRQRRRDSGEPSLRIWPVPTRVELAEKERLEAARDAARATFDRYLGHLRRRERASYWGMIEVLYQPYFAYEEVLAIFAERKRRNASLLASLEALTRFISQNDVWELAEMPESERQRGLRLFSRQGPAKATASSGKTPSVFVSYARDTIDTAELIVSNLRENGYLVWWDRELLPGDDWLSEHEDALERSVAMIFVRGKETTDYRQQLEEAEWALQHKKRVIPVISKGGTLESIPLALRRYTPLPFDRTGEADGLAVLIKSLKRVTRAEDSARRWDPEDPQKGQWGGSSSANGRQLSAQVRPLSDDWFEVELEVSSSSSHPLVGSVEFHLHPTFFEPIRRVEADDGRARVRLGAWGAFTVGAICDDGRTTLELDLSQNPSFPERFRAR